jgi:hypothetical protein
MLSDDRRGPLIVHHGMEGFLVSLAWKAASDALCVARAKRPDLEFAGQRLDRKSRPAPEEQKRAKNISTVEKD